MSTFQIRKAERKQSKIRLGLSGPSGSGKTYTALLIAFGLTNDWSKIAVIDTEQGSADLYENLGDYNVVQISAPFEPEKYIAAQKACVDAGMEVIIIDSASHVWSGKGGCLDIHETIVKTQRVANSYTAWAQVTPRFQSFIDNILQTPCHVITTLRAKTDYVLAEKNGKQVPQKVGMAAQMRDGFEYELTLAFELDQEHNAFAGKDRTGLFMGKPAFTPNADTGKKILEWCNSGKSVEPLNMQEVSIDLTVADTLGAVKTIWDSYPNHHNNKEFIAAVTKRKSELESNSVPA